MFFLCIVKEKNNIICENKGKEGKKRKQMSCSYCGFSKPNQKTACCGQTYCNQICLSNNLDQHHFQCIGEEYTKEEIKKANKWWDSLDWFINTAEYQDQVSSLDKELIIDGDISDGRKLSLLKVKVLIINYFKDSWEFSKHDYSLTTITPNGIAYLHKRMWYPEPGFLSGDAKILLEPKEKFVQKGGKYVLEQNSGKFITRAKEWWDSLDYYLDVDEQGYRDLFDQNEYKKLPLINRRVVFYAQDLALKAAGKTRKEFNSALDKSTFKSNLFSSFKQPGKHNIWHKLESLTYPHPTYGYKLQDGVLTKFKINRE